MEIVYFIDDAILNLLCATFGKFDFISWKDAYNSYNISKKQPLHCFEKIIFFSLFTGFETYHLLYLNDSIKKLKIKLYKFGVLPKHILIKLGNAKESNK